MNDEIKTPLDTAKEAEVKANEALASATAAHAEAAKLAAEHKAGLAAVPEGEEHHELRGQWQNAVAEANAAKAEKGALLLAARAEVKAAKGAVKEARAAERAAKKAEAEAKKAEAEAKKAARVEKNGVTRPSEGTKTGRVWEAADTISAQHSRPALLSEVKESLASEVEAGTISTQYSRWCQFNDVSAEARKSVRDALKPAPADPEPAPSPTEASETIPAEPETAE